MFQWSKCKQFCQWLNKQKQVNQLSYKFAPSMCFINKLISKMLTNSLHGDCFHFVHLNPRAASELSGLTAPVVLASAGGFCWCLEVCSPVLGTKKWWNLRWSVDVFWVACLTITVQRGIWRELLPRVSPELGSCLIDPNFIASLVASGKVVLEKSRQLTCGDRCGSRQVTKLDDWMIRVPNEQLENLIGKEGTNLMARVALSLVTAVVRPCHYLDCEVSLGQQRGDQ